MSSSVNRLVLAGLLTGVTDGLFSGMLSAFFYNSTATRLFQGVASMLIGPKAIEGGTPTAALGLLMHFGVAFAWSAVFIFAMMRMDWVQRLLASPGGVVKMAMIFGPLVWVVMSFVVIPAMTHRAPVLNTRWFTQFVGHAVFVGLPIVSVASSVGGRP
ncbi:MAG TPA: hypothetical protein VGG73_08635 [Vicinamibacterales bacterium]|jgi:hypothetical protein